MSRLIFLLILLSFGARADKTAESGQSRPSQTGTQPAPRDLSKKLDARGLVCTDLGQALCFQAGEVINDGTGTTQESGTLKEATIQRAREFFRRIVAVDSRLVTEINKLIADGSIQSDLRAVTGESCEIQEAQCKARVKAKLLDVFEDEQLKDMKLADRQSILEGCDRPRCKYTDHQAEAFYRLIQADKLGKLFEICEENAGKFYETQNVSTRKRVLELFPKIREEMKRVIAGMNLSPEIQELIGQKLDAVSISTDCMGEGHNPNSFAWSDIRADGSRVIVICDGLLTGNSSDFSLVFSLAHELTHQFDPCFIHYGPQNFRYKLDPSAKLHEDYEKQNPFYDGIKCLRDPKKSAGAVLTYNFSEDYFLANLDMNAKPEQKLTPFCDADRIPETFADAIGSKVLASFFQNKDNTGGREFSKDEWRAGLLNTSYAFAQPSINCRSASAMTFQSTTDEYASIHLRLNGLLMANKEIRRLAGCEKESLYAQCL